MGRPPGTQNRLRLTDDKPIGDFVRGLAVSDVMPSVSTLPNRVEHFKAIARQLAEDPQAFNIFSKVTLSAIIDSIVGLEDWLAILDKMKEQALSGSKDARGDLHDWRWGKATERHQIESVSQIIVQSNIPRPYQPALESREGLDTPPADME